MESNARKEGGHRNHYRHRRKKVIEFLAVNERYLLQVIAPEYKAALFGKAGGR